MDEAAPVNRTPENELLHDLKDNGQNQKIVVVFRDSALEMEVSRCLLELELFLLGFLQQRSISMMEDLLQQLQELLNTPMNTFCPVSFCLWLF